MISGRSGGTGRYSYREVSSGNSSVMVSHMPDDDFKVRIVFRNSGETNIPILKVYETEALLLWASLKLMAEDLNWDDRMAEERFKDLDKKEKDASK